jgi:hypothetical protein
MLCRADAGLVRLLTVSETVNPYAVTPTELATRPEPVLFGGTLTRDDLLVSMRDAPPKRGWSRLRYPLTVVLIVVMISLLNASGAAGSALGSIWPIAIYPLLPAWMWLVRLVTPFYRRRRRRMEASAAQPMLDRGWIDPDHVVIYDEHSFLRSSWDFFGSAFVFESHLLLPVATDSTIRLIFPFRFFASPADAKQALAMVEEKVGCLVNSPPNDHSLADQVQSMETAAAGYQIDETLAWNSTHWPFESDESEQHDFAIDLTGKRQGWKFTLIAVLTILGYGLWYFLPIWLACIVWLIRNFRQAGDASFLLDQPVTTAIIMIPAAWILLLFLNNAVQAIFRIRGAQSQPFLIRLRSTGVHLSHASFQSWFRWSAVDRVLIESDSAGWVVKKNQDQVRFPLACFESREVFEAFKQRLAELSRRS